MNRTKDGLGLS